MQEVVEAISCRSQVDLSHLLAFLALVISRRHFFNSDTEEVSFIDLEALFLFVNQMVRFRPGSELEAAKFLVVRVLKVLEKATNFRLGVTLPLLVVFVILRKNLNLDEVLVGFEERELLEQSLPGDRIVLVSRHHLVRDHTRLLHLC